MQTTWTKQTFGCCFQAEIWRAGWEPSASRGSITQTGNFSKFPSPFDHLTGLICFYHNFWRGKSDVSLWSRREKVKSFYFNFPFERRRLTRAKCSFLVVPLSHFQDEKRNLSVTSQEVVCYSWAGKKKKRLLNPSGMCSGNCAVPCSSWRIKECCAMEWGKSARIRNKN